MEYTMLFRISPHLFSVVSMLFLLYGIALSDSSSTETPTSITQADSRVLISDTTVTSDSSELLPYQPGKDQHFLDASKAPTDFTPLKNVGPGVPDRPDVLRDFSPYSPAKK